MLLTALSWMGYPVLQSVAISLFFTTNLMYMFMAILDDVTSETQHPREKTIQMEELNAEINGTDNEHESQEALDLSTVCSDDELAETISEKSFESACLNMEDKKNEWSNGEHHYENQHYNLENYDDEDFGNEFRTHFDQDPFTVVYVRYHCNTVSTENGDDDDDDDDDDDVDVDEDNDDGSNSWEASSNEIVHASWWRHMPTVADILQAEVTTVSTPDETVSSCQIPSLSSVEETDEDGDPTIENENIFSLNSKLDATIQCLENQYKQTNLVFPRLLEANSLLLEMVTFFKEKDDLIAKLESATESLEQYKQEKDELFSKLSAAIEQGEFHRRTRETDEDRYAKLEKEKTLLSWQLDAANATSRNYLARSNQFQENCSRLEEENRELDREISVQDSVLGDMNKLVSELNGEIANLRQQLSAAHALIWSIYQMPESGMMQ